MICTINFVVVHEDRISNMKVKLWVIEMRVVITLGTNHSRVTIIIQERTQWNVQTMGIFFYFYNYFLYSSPSGVINVIGI